MQLISLEKKIKKHLLETEHKALYNLLDHIQGDFEIEIGCGNGHFLVDYGKTTGETHLIGIEMKGGRCKKTREKIEKRGLDNIHIIQGTAEEVIEALPPDSVSRYHIYFPDPWPKNKHRKRRFLRMPNLDAIYKTLKPSGGAIYFASDIFDYYLQAKMLFLLHGGFKPEEVPPPEAVFNSVFADRFTRLGKESYFISCVKK